MEQFGLKEILVGIVLLFQVIGVKMLFRGLDTLEGIKAHLAKLNGRIGTCEELRQVHERNDTEKHSNCEERLHDVEKTMLGMRKP